MATDILTVPSTLVLQELVDDYILRYRVQDVPVVEGGIVRGLVDAKAVKSIDRARWATATVAEVMNRDLRVQTVHPSDDVLQALARMAKAKIGSLLVIEGGRLVGMVTRQHIVELLHVKLTLEG